MTFSRISKNVKQLELLYTDYRDVNDTTILEKQFYNFLES